MIMTKNRNIRIAAIILWLVQLAGEGLLVMTLMKTDLIPSKYLIFAIAGAVLLLVITGVLAFLPKTDKKQTTVRLVIGSILSVLIAAACVYTCFPVTQIRQKVENAVVTDMKTVTSNIGIYTLADNDAVSIADAGGFIFAVNTFYDTENSDTAVEIINAENGFDIKTKVYDTPAAMVSALYCGEVDAMILNEAYMEILRDLYEMEGIEDFKNIDTDLKLLYEIKASREIEENGKTTGTAKAEAIPETGRLRMGVAVKSAPADTTDHAAASSDDDTDGSVEDPATADDQNIDVLKDPFVIYISGSDTRSETLEVSRSDVNILLVVNPVSRQVLLVNTPRDYYVENPAGDNAMDKLTHCGIYGIDCSIKALENLYETNIDFYAQINFSGFEKLIDAIGGVTVVSETAFSAGGYDFAEGENELDGEMALVFARERHSFEDGDNQRGINQMKVITAIIDKVSENSVDILGNFKEIMDSLDKMFVTNMSDKDFAGISQMALYDNEVWELALYAVKGEDGYGETYSMPGYQLYIMIPDMNTVARASELISMVIEGRSFFGDGETVAEKPVRALIWQPLTEILENN